MTTMIMLESSDGQVFEVEARVVCKSSEIRDFIKTIDRKPNQDNVVIKPIAENDTIKYSFSIRKVSGSILGKVIEYLKMLADFDVGEIISEDREKFEADFVNVDQPILVQYAGAAESLSVVPLRELVINKFAEKLLENLPEMGF